MNTSLPPITFQWPIMLLSLLVVPLLALAFYAINRRRRQAAAGFVVFGSAPERRRGSGFRGQVPPLLFLAGLSLSLLALSRPQAVVSVPRVQGTVILAFDVSGSMAAEDLEPTRMDAAKAAAQEFIDRQPSTVQIGVVAFSDNGFAVQSPTNDPYAIESAITRISVQKGTSLGQGILSALNTLTADAEGGIDPNAAEEAAQPPLPPGTYTPAAIILLSDGENNEDPDPLEIAQMAADRGVRIYTVGVGSASGIDLHINDITVNTRLDEPMLQEIARMTGGEYYNAQSTQELLSIYDNLNPQLVVRPEHIEITSLLAGASLAVLLLGIIFSMLWYNRAP